MAKVSVIIPVYNVEKYLKKCLDALLNQTMRDIEIICVNDGSADKSGEILEQYAKKDKRIKIITKENGGLSDARNFGMAKAGSEYIMFCDSDDWYEPEMCDVMYRAMKDNNVDMAMCGITVVYDAQHHMKKSDDNYYRIRFSGKHRITDKLARDTDVSAWNKIYRKDMISKYRLEFPVGLSYEDAYFFNAYLATSRNVYYIQKKLYNYVRREGSIMSETFDGNPRAIEHIYVAFKLYDFLVKNHLYEKYKRTFWTEFVEYYWFARTWAPKKMQGEIRRISRKFVRKHKQEVQKFDGELEQQLRNIGLMSRKIIKAPARVLRRIYSKFLPSYRRSQYVLDVGKGVMQELDRIEAKIDSLAKS